LIQRAKTNVKRSRRIDIASVTLTARVNRFPAFASNDADFIKRLGKNVSPIRGRCFPDQKTQKRAHHDPVLRRHGMGAARKVSAMPNTIRVPWPAI
jgi:hypothetical protein